MPHDSAPHEHGLPGAAAPAPTDEFRFLAGDAARVGRSDPIPAVTRVAARLADGRTVSGLSFSNSADSSSRSSDDARDATGTGPNVVALHGAGLNAHSFDPALLALNLPALALDLPGHGRSDWRSDASYRPDTLAADTIAALEQLAPGRSTLIGHSLGGLTAAIIAAQRPDLVQRLIIIDITPGVSASRNSSSVTEFIAGQRDFASLDEMVERAVQFGIGSDRTALMRGVALNSRQRADGRFEWTHHFAHLASMSSAATASSTDPGSTPVSDTPYAPIWAALEAAAAHGIPVTLVRASHGMVSEEQAAEWLERLPESHVITIDGPHNLHEAAPAELASQVRAIMGTVDLD